MRIEEYGGFDKVLEAALAETSWFSAEDLRCQYDVHIETYGFVHDTGFFVVFEERTNIEDDDAPYGSGWETIETEYKAAVARAKTRWDYCTEYGYH